MAKKRRNRDYIDRLRAAHRSSEQMSLYAGRLLEQIESLQRDLRARDAVISALRSELEGRSTTQDSDCCSA
jgi:predicted RNase H-like nuclease (RuvC/YqgF family)